MSPTYAHRKVFDLAALERAKRDAVQAVLNEQADIPFGRIRQATNARVTVTSSSLTRLDFAMKGRDEAMIVEWRGEEPRHGVVKADGGPVSVSWLPTGRLPAGGIELADHIFDDPPAVKDVFISEAEAIIERSTPGDFPSPPRPKE